MDGGDLYDEFGNYIGPELESEESEAEEEEEEREVRCVGAHLLEQLDRVGSYLQLHVHMRKI